MTYIVLRDFLDTEDISKKSPRGHFYKKGDSYPRKGLKMSQERIYALVTCQNVAGAIFIREKSDRDG